jgi:hypothetical protein
MKVDGSLTVYGYKEIDVALKRMNTKDDYDRIKENCPKKELMNLLKARKNEGPPLSGVIAELEQIWTASLVLKTSVPKHVPRLNVAPKKKRKPRKTSKKLRAVKSQTRRKPAIPIYTDIAGFYYDMEMVEQTDAVEQTIPETGTGPGNWYRGKIISERWTELNDLVYECVFNTPLRHSHWYTEAYAHKAVQSFQDNQVAHGWRCAPPPATYVHVELMVGDEVSRWFPTHELPKNFEDKQGVQGAYVQGLITEIAVVKKQHTYKCSFDAPVSSEMWLTVDETALLRKCFQERQPVTQSVERTSKRPFNATLAKGGIQRETVAAACGVVRRVSRTQPVFIPGTQPQVETNAEGISCGAEAGEINRPDGMSVNAEQFMKFVKSFTAADLAALEDTEDEDSDIDPGDETSDNAVPKLPTALYNNAQKSLRKRIFPCPICNDPADGGHQCGKCFAHVHVICGTPYPGSSEGYGQPVVCGRCLGMPVQFVKPNRSYQQRTQSKLSLAKNRQRKQQTIMPSTPSVQSLPVVKLTAANVFRNEDASTSTKAVDPPNVPLQKEGGPAETTQQHQDAFTPTEAVDPPDANERKEGEPAQTTQQHKDTMTSTEADETRDETSQKEVHPAETTQEHKDTITSTEADETRDETSQMEVDPAETTQEHKDTITSTEADDTPQETLQKELDPAETTQLDQDAITSSKAGDPPGANERTDEEQHQEAFTPTEDVDPPDANERKEGEPAQTTQQHEDTISSMKAADPPDGKLRPGKKKRRKAMPAYMKASEPKNNAKRRKPSPGNTKGSNTASMNLNRHGEPLSFTTEVQNIGYTFADFNKEYRNHKDSASSRVMDVESASPNKVVAQGSNLLRKLGNLNSGKRVSKKKKSSTTDLLKMIATERATRRKEKLRLVRERNRPKKESSANDQFTNKLDQHNEETLQGEAECKDTSEVGDDWYQWKGEWYKWSDYNTGDTDATSSKEVKRDRVNTRLRNWIAAMRRNMRPECKEAALQPFTITRDKLDEVSTLPFHPMYA